MQQVWSGRHGKPFSIDHVLEEGLTHLRARVGDERVSRIFSEWFWTREEPPFDWLLTDEQTLREATELHLKHYARKLSMTDAILIVHARRTGAAIATLDAGFAGLVPLVDP